MKLHNLIIYRPMNRNPTHNDIWDAVGDFL